jgi:hypothetical protein
VSSTTGGENSVVQMLGSLYDSIENDYGAFPTRLYRAFRPKSGNCVKDLLIYVAYVVIVVTLLMILMLMLLMLIFIPFLLHCGDLWWARHMLDMDSINLYKILGRAKDNCDSTEVAHIMV